MDIYQVNIIFLSELDELIFLYIIHVYTGTFYRKTCNLKNFFFLVFRSLDHPVQQIFLHLPLSSTTSLQFASGSNLTSLLTQFSHLRHGLPIVLFPSGFSLITAFIIVSFFSRHVRPTYIFFFTASLDKHGLWNMVKSSSLVRIFHSPIFE